MIRHTVWSRRVMVLTIRGPIFIEVYLVKSPEGVYIFEDISYA